MLSLDVVFLTAFHFFDQLFQLDLQLVEELDSLVELLLDLDLGLLPEHQEIRHFKLLVDLHHHLLCLSLTPIISTRAAFMAKLSICLVQRCTLARLR